jgi:hypothetical protein
MSATGAAMFARFAYPPNTLGYCGPAESEALFAYGSGEQVPDRGLDQLAGTFEGAWPYLELLAGAVGTDDPLDTRVVEAYWLGNEALARVDVNDWGWHLHDRFGPRCGSGIGAITDTVGDGSTPNHAFQVLGVYPWVGMLRAGRGGAEPLRVIDRCRIRWGRVLETDEMTALVRSQPLVWRDRLSLGAPVTERVSVGLDRRASPGDAVALHWDWVCHRLTARQLAWLEQVTAGQLTLANRSRLPL